MRSHVGRVGAARIDDRRQAVDSEHRINEAIEEALLGLGLDLPEVGFKVHLELTALVSLIPVQTSGAHGQRRKLWDGMGWDGMGWDGMGWDGMGWDGMR